MSESDVFRRRTAAEKNVNRLRNCMPEKLNTFCKMHLSFILELDGSKLEEMFLDGDTEQCEKKKNVTPFSVKKKERYCSSSPLPLNKDIVCYMYRLINHLNKPEILKTEGLFRKTGNVNRQRLLREWISEEMEFQLNDSTFSPHDVATVLKQLLSEFPEPLLTKRHCEAHIQIAGMSSHCISESDRSHAREKQLKALQLMMLLLPRENAILLECLFSLLHNVSSIAENKMTSSSLGIVFAPSLLCPKKVSPEELHLLFPMLGKAVAIMIDLAPYLFTVPRELSDDIAHFWHEMEDPNIDVFSTEKENMGGVVTMEKGKYGNSSAVNTVLTFAERKSPEEFHSTQDTQVALAQLYAHVQSMPESAKKKKLLKQFNRAGGALPNGAQKVKHSRSRSFGESLKKRFPILSKHKSHDLCEKDEEDDNRIWHMSKAVAIDNSAADINYMTPDNKFNIPNVRQHSPSVVVVDLGASPCSLHPRKRRSDECLDSLVKDAKIANASAKTLFPSTPILQRPVAMVSPITQSVNEMPELRKKALMTPRSRVPVLMINSPNVSYTESVL